MGAAAFYAAALAGGKRAAAYFWVTDLPTRGKSFFDPLPPAEMRTKEERYRQCRWICPCLFMRGTMLPLEQFSIYNNLLVKRQPQANPLRDLLPADRDHGWHVARNLLKPLNHLDFLREKEQIAIELGLHSTLTPPALFEANYALLAEHQAQRVSTSDVIRHLAAQSHRVGAGLSEADVSRRLQAYPTVRHMEFHPSDVCNLAAAAAPTAMTIRRASRCRSAIRSAKSRRLPGCGPDQW